MRLDELIQGLPGADVEKGAELDIDVSAITRDSRAVVPGSLFCCVVGSSVDAHTLVPDALAAGASALLVERHMQDVVPEIVVPNVGDSLGQVASAFYRSPQTSLKMFGITGTNGKTTTAHILNEIISKQGWRGEVIGTLSGKRTTPDAIDLYAQLRSWVDDGVEAVTMEVSSHALDQGRVNGICFDLAIFTNLTQDHLDYHQDMEAYFAAKSKLFEPVSASVGVVNADDSFGRRLLEEPRIKLVPYSLADASDIEYGPQETTFIWRHEKMRLRLPAEHNVYNALAAATAASCAGIGVSEIAEGLSALHSVSGRMERIDEGQPFQVFVDYAHTPDGLENVLKAARMYASEAQGRTVVVFGCGGDRDAAKRPIMGSIAERLGDVVYVTSDNPRHEDPQVIIDQIMNGITERRHVCVEIDRAEAIQSAIKEAGQGDVVVIAGKGHESGQEIADVVIPFDDREIARAAIRSADVVS